MFESSLKKKQKKNATYHQQLLFPFAKIFMFEQKHRKKISQLFSRQIRKFKCEFSTEIVSKILCTF
jgi:hypothetical protein